ncbi:MAG: alpha/beta fold hydrolase [Dehalococcoidia bacterium]
MDVTGDDFVQLWGAVECPVLHLVGEDSNWKRTEFRGRPIDDYFADATTVVIEGAGHEVHSRPIRRNVVADSEVPRSRLI